MVRDDNFRPVSDRQLVADILNAHFAQVAVRKRLGESPATGFTPAPKPPPRTLSEAQRARWADPDKRAAVEAALAAGKVRARVLRLAGMKLSEAEYDEAKRLARKGYSIAEAVEIVRNSRRFRRG